LYTQFLAHIRSVEYEINPPVTPQRGSSTKPRASDQRERRPGWYGTRNDALKGQKQNIKYDNMAQSLSKVYLHVVFHIKTTSPKIKEEHMERMHSYIGQLVNNTGCKVIRVGGMPDHVHVVCTLSREMTIAHLVEELKRNSSRWIKTLDEGYKCFAWQNGYAVFSVCQSVIDKTVTYVINQREHHAKVSFKDEYLQLLKLYGIEYDERYVFCD
jgi:REP element-mobilizing transposase RayT